MTTTNPALSVEIKTHPTTRQPMIVRGDTSQELGVPFSPRQRRLYTMALRTAQDGRFEVTDYASQSGAWQLGNLRLYWGRGQDIDHLFLVQPHPLQGHDLVLGLPKEVYAVLVEQLRELVARMAVPVEAQGEGASHG